MKHKLGIIMIMVLITAVAFGATACSKEPPLLENDLAAFRLIVPAEWELEVGDSRSVDYAFSAAVTDRKLSWSVNPTTVATVDEWGRVTAVAAGTATITAGTQGGQSDSVTLNVVTASTLFENETTKIDFSGTAVSLGDNMQKIVTRYAKGDASIPTQVSAVTDFSANKTATTADGAVWTITDYGILRENNAETNARDRQQRFMGDRYFYSTDTTGGAVLGVFPDGGNGVWTVMADGVTHIEMKDLSGTEKAAIMSATTEQYVSRRGMVSEAYLVDGEWVPNESDNDGLWTSMYAAGELMRYSVLKSNGSATEAEIAAARQSAVIATEAVLLLSNICMRTGETEAYVRYQPNGRTDTYNGRWLSYEALLESGNAALNVPNSSPADVFEFVYDQYVNEGNDTYFLGDNYLSPIDDGGWSDPAAVEGEYAYYTRNLEGYVARTYSFKDEGKDTNGYMYWSFNGDGTATGTSSKKPEDFGYVMNGENMRGEVVDASGTIPQRLWDDLIGEGYTVQDIIYKGDTSSDELIGHLFLYKLAYDILGPVDEELKSIIVSTMDNLAQHVSDNNYMMVDGTGQPDTWSKFNRQFFYNSSQLGGAPLTASVVLSLFKLAAYVTGNQKWENEYRMAALDPSYEYAQLMGQYAEQCELYMIMLANDITPILGKLVKNKRGTPFTELLTRLFLNYSDEEMAMLAFYLLFQMEDDEEILEHYREAIDDWWISIKYSENPLWYYIYQLAYPTKTITDAYGNNILETAAWSLSRHPVDTRRYTASNSNRDDMAEFALADYGLDEGTVMSFSLVDGNPVKAGKSKLISILKVFFKAPDLTWAVAAPDERNLHKYNGSTYSLSGGNSSEMEGSTTYTLPFWLGMYHGMLADN